MAWREKKKDNKKKQEPRQAVLLWPRKKRRTTIKNFKIPGKYEIHPENQRKAIFNTFCLWAIGKKADLPYSSEE